MVSGQSAEMTKAEILSVPEPIKESLTASSDRRPVCNAKEIFDRGTRWHSVADAQPARSRRVAKTL